MADRDERFITNEQAKAGVKARTGGSLLLMISEVKAPFAKLVGIAGTEARTERELEVYAGVPVVLHSCIQGAAKARLSAKTEAAPTTGPIEAVTKADGWIAMEVPPDLVGPVRLVMVDDKDDELAEWAWNLAGPPEGDQGADLNFEDLVAGIDLPLDGKGYGAGADSVYLHRSCTIRLDVTPARKGAAPVGSWVKIRVYSLHAQLMFPDGDPVPSGLRCRLLQDSGAAAAA